MSFVTIGSNGKDAILSPAAEAAKIRDSLGVLEGGDRLPASSVKDLPRRCYFNTGRITEGSSGGSNFDFPLVTMPANTIQDGDILVVRWFFQATAGTGQTLWADLMQNGSIVATLASWFNLNISGVVQSRFVPVGPGGNIALVTNENDDSFRSGLDANISTSSTIDLEEPLDLRIRVRTTGTSTLWHYGIEHLRDGF